MQVMHVAILSDGIKTKLIGFSDHMTGFHTAAGKPHGKSIDVVIPPGRFAGFAHGRAAKFTAPNHQRIVQQAACF